MKKLMFIVYFFGSFCLMMFLLGNGSLTNDNSQTSNKEMTKPFSEIIMYCNTNDFIKKMAKEDYKLDLAAKGTIFAKQHGNLVSMNLLMNQRNKQWAIIFNYNQGNIACIIGGNHIELYSP